MKTRCTAAAFAVTALTIAAGCASPRGALFEPVDPPVRWPPPPAPPRIEYVGSLRTDADLKAGRSIFEGIGEALFGKEDQLGMLTPLAVTTDGADRVFVCDSNAQLVHVFDLAKRKYEQWVPDPELAVFSQPVGIAWDPRGRLLVADSVAGAVYAFDGTGAYLGDLGRDHLQRPCGIVPSLDGNRLFVADAGAHEVVVLAIDGELLERIGTRGAGPGQFNFPTNVALDGAGNLYVSDSLNFRVQVFDRDLRFTKQVGSQGDLPGYFSQPKGVAVDGAGRIFVVDAHFEAVQVFDREGRLLMTFGEEGRGPGQFWLPNGIHIDSRERIWVADPYNKRVQMFRGLSETEVQP